VSQEIKNKELEKIQKKIKQYNTPKGKKILQKDIQKNGSGLYDEIKEYNEDKESFQIMFKHADKLIIKNEKDNLYQFKSFEALKKEAEKSHKIWIKETNYGKSFQVQKTNVLQTSTSVETTGIETPVPASQKTIGITDTKASPLLVKDKKALGFVIIVPLLIVGIIVWKIRK